MVDSVRVFDPGFRITDSGGAPVSGAKIKFYAATTTTPRTVYSDSGLSSSLGSTVYCGSDGFPVASQGSGTEVTVYTGTTAFKVVITDSSDVEIATFDNLLGALDTSSFLTTESTSTLSFPVVSKTSDYTIVSDDRGKVINANATGGDITLTMTAATTLGDGFNVEVRHSGTANSVILSTSQSFSYGGTTATTYALAPGETVQVACDAAAFHVINAISFPLLPPPQGYLTLTSATPVISSDVTSAAAVYYTPFVGNIAPVWNGVRFMPRTFTELTLNLSSSHSSNSIYDIFLFSNSGTLTLATGPVWSTLTAGAGARGTGAGTTQISKVNGFWTNTVAMTGRNGNSTYSIGAGYGTYLGSILIDASAGQVSCHRTWGQSRKWGVWNAYNKQDIVMQVGDSTSAWTYGSATVRSANGSTANSATSFVGLAEDLVTARLFQNIGSNTNGERARCGIGFNSTTAYSSFVGQLYMSAGATSGLQSASSTYISTPLLGQNVLTCLESLPGASGVANYAGTPGNMVMFVSYRG